MLVSKQHRKLLLNLREPERVLTVIPTARALQVKGKTLVAVPHREDEVRVLKNLGFDPPSPIATYYDYPGRYRPYAHQATTAEFLTVNPRAFCHNGMGAGKTLSVLWAFDYLRKNDTLDWMLVVSPLSTLERAWGDEIFRNFPDMSFAVVHGTRERRHKLLRTDFDVYIINHDGLKNADTVALLAEKPGRGLVVVDEVASYRNASTERWKSLNRIINNKTNPREWAWGLTGTPTPNGPTDAWAQARLITPARAPRSFIAFRETVMQPVTRFKWVPREGSLAVVKELMQPSIRFAREDCIDLPPTTFVTRQTQLTADQTRAYNDMLKKFKAEHEGGQITAVNEAVKVSKLLQIALGKAYSANGDVTIPAEHRVELVKEIIEEAGAKVLVFVPLTGALEVLAEELAKHWSVAVVHGATSRTQRDEIFKNFQNHPEPRIIVANPGTLSHGLTLTAADTIVWFAPINSNETYQQANARIVRPGQKRNTLIVNIEATDLERKMYARLQGRERMQGLLLDLLKGGPT